jgi:hypothetical protein
MKPKPIIASATIAILCTVYLVRLNHAVNQTVGEPAKNAIAVASATPSETTSYTTDVNFSNLDAALRGLKTSKTTVIINNSTPQNVTGKKGTVLYLPADIFQDAKGNAHTGKVRIELEECYDVSDMLAANLSTTSNGKLLETAGMVNIKAYAGNKPLQLRSGARLNIYFPKNGEEKNDYELFYGEWLANDIINWKLAGNSEPIDEKEITALSTTTEDLALDEANDNSLREEVVTAFVPAAEQRKLKEDDNCYLHISKSHLRRGTQISEMDYFNWKTDKHLTSGL